MRRQTVMPKKTGCTDPSAPRMGFFGKGPRLHKWEHSSMWNGNTKRVLPFTTFTHGISRSGWRCYHCGKFVWDDDDAIYALKEAYYLGLLPDFQDLMQGSDLPIKPQSIRAHDAAVEVSMNRKEDQK